MKPFWEITEAEVKKCLEVTSWPTAVLEYFRGGGYSSCYLSRGGMPMTMIRLSLVRGLGPVLRSPRDGRSICPPPFTACSTNGPTPPGRRPGLFQRHRQGAVHRCLLRHEQLERNHGAISYGHIGADVISLASLLPFRSPCTTCPTTRFFRPAPAFRRERAAIGRLSCLCQLRPALRLDRAA